MKPNQHTHHAHNATKVMFSEVVQMCFKNYMSAVNPGSPRKAMGHPILSIPQKADNPMDVRELPKKLDNLRSLVT